MSPVCDQCILRSQNILSFNPIRLEGGVQGEALQVGAKLCFALPQTSIFVAGFCASPSACIVERRLRILPAALRDSCWNLISPFPSSPPAPLLSQIIEVFGMSGQTCLAVIQTFSVHVGQIFLMWVKHLAKK